MEINAIHMSSSGHNHKFDFHCVNLLNIHVILHRDTISYIFRTPAIFPYAASLGLE